MLEELAAQGAARQSLPLELEACKVVEGLHQVEGNGAGAAGIVLDELYLCWLVIACFGQHNAVFWVDVIVGKGDLSD